MRNKADRPVQNLEHDLDLAGLIGVLLDYWKIIVGLFLLCVLAAVAFLVLADELHSGSLVAQGGIVRLGIAGAQEIESVETIKIRLLRPENYSTEVLTECDVTDKNNPREFLAKSIKFTTVETSSSIFQLSVTRPKAAIKGCLSSLFEMVQKEHDEISQRFVDATKNQLLFAERELAASGARIKAQSGASAAQWVVYLANQQKMALLTERIFSLKNSLDYMAINKTRLIMPNDISFKPEFPNKPLILVFGALMGLLLGILAALGHKMLSRPWVVKYASII